MSKRRLTFVPRDALRCIVRTAVDRSLERSAEDDLSDRLAREMVLAIRNAGPPVPSMSRSDVLEELERTNHALVQARDRARAELELQRGTESQRVKGAASREAHALEHVGLAFARAERDGLSLHVLRDEMNALVLEVARRERHELLTGLRARRDRRIDVLERRLAKLNRSLEISEAALRELAGRKSLDDGLASIYRTVQGLSGDEPDADRKRQLLAEIFRANAELRELHAEHAEAERTMHAAAG